MKVSIIIPVYNVEKYLPRCVQSVFEQTYKDIEIVLVDDGTKDNSGILCDNYAKEDSRVKVIHKENGGLSSARNAGLEIASGDAIFFLDSDDYLSKRCIEKMVKLMDKTESDIAIVQMKYIPEDMNDEAPAEPKDNVKVMTAERAIEESLYQRLYTCCAPAKLYKRSAIGDVRFPLGKISEDLATCHLFLDNAKKVTYTSYYGYYYRQHEESIMHVFNPKRLDALQWVDEIELFCKEKYPAILGASYCRSFNVAIHLILDLPDSGEIHDEYKKIIWTKVKATRMKTLFNGRVRFREKAAAILSFFGERILKAVWNSKMAVRKD